MRSGDSGTSSSLLPRLEPHVLAGHLPRLVVSTRSRLLLILWLEYSMLNLHSLIDLSHGELQQK